MTPSSLRSIDDYLRALRAALAGADPALIQDALYDAEEHLRAEAAANPGKSEAELLEQIARTYGAPDEVAAAYRDTETKVNAALQPPVSRVAQPPTAVVDSSLSIRIRARTSRCFSWFSASSPAVSTSPSP